MYINKARFDFMFKTDLKLRLMCD